MRSATSISADIQELGPAEVHRVRHALDDVLGSRPFRSTQQCSALLRYIVEHSLVGADGLLRERVIGAEVFGRPPGYETNEDPVVRLRAAEVRKRLAQFYSAGPEPFDVKIEIPSGSYRAVFQFRSAEAAHLPPASEPSGDLETVPVQMVPTDVVHSAVEVAPPSVEAASTTLPHKSNRLAAMLLAAALLLIVLGIAIFWNNTPEKICFRRFWAPWTSSNTPVILAIGSNAVYRLKPDYVTRYSQEHGLAAQGLEIYPPLGNDTPVPASDFIPQNNSYVMWGDVAAISGFSAHLAKENQPFQDRFPNDISFAEIRSTPSILVGGFNNPMTIALTKNLRFIMLGGDEIVDTDTHQKWTLQSLDTADLAILTRLVQKDGDAPFLSTAGLGQYGTLAAAQLVCDPAALYRLSRQLPKDWTSKNLQAVLRVSIVNYKPTITDIVAYKSW